MAIETEVRLRSRNGQTTVEPPKTKKKKNRPSKKQRLLARTNADKQDACADMYEAAQAQLQQEMQAAGMMGSLPMSFGGSRKRKRSEGGIVEVHEEIEIEDDDGKEEEDVVVVVTATEEVVDLTNDDQGEGNGAGEDSRTAGDTADPPRNDTTIVDKVRVVYDSDGEVAERVIEKVEVAVEVHPAESVRDVQHKNSTPENKNSATTKENKYPVPKDVVKFYVQRHLLFYKFEEGIQLDHESWYSVTPQAIAEHIAQRLTCDVVVDPFAGCGGNVIQLAKTCKQVIAIDIDPEKIRMAKHNAAIYGVADKIEWIVGNSIEILPKLKADAVFLSPPWGGVKYSRKRFSLDDMVIKGVSGVKLFAMARKVTKNIAYYLPRGTPTHDLEALSPEEDVECEKIFLNKQLKVVTAYYGDLVGASKDIKGESPSDETPVA